MEEARGLEDEEVGEEISGLEDEEVGEEDSGKEDEEVVEDEDEDVVVFVVEVVFKVEDV